MHCKDDEVSEAANKREEREVKKDGRNKGQEWEEKKERVETMETEEKLLNKKKERKSAHHIEVLVKRHKIAPQRTPQALIEKRKKKEEREREREGERGRERERKASLVSSHISFLYLSLSHLLSYTIP